MWNGTKTFEEMKKDQVDCLKLQGFVLVDGQWHGKHYSAVPTDDPGYPIEDGKFNCLVIRYQSNG